MKLTALEKRSALSIYEAIFPSSAGETISLGARDVAMGAYLDDYFASCPALSTITIRLGLFLMQILPLFFIGKLKLFKNLSKPDKEKYLERWSKNKIYLIRQLALLVKVVGAFGYCGFPEVQRQMGIVKEKQFPPV